jgi:Fe-S-cluster containining protein
MNEYCESLLRRGESRFRDYSGFLASLKKRRNLPLDALFREAHERAFRKIDCLECGNCCFSLGPRVRHDDISALASKLGQKPSAFIDSHLLTDEDGDMVFRFLPCPFLNGDNYCLVYETRPQACREYPHMNRGRQVSRLSMHSENLRFCPAVVFAAEWLIKETGGINPKAQRG